MPIIIDTQIIIWLEQDFEKIPNKVLNQINNSNKVYFSKASIWEIAIKLAIGKLTIKKDLEAFVKSFAADYNFLLLDIDLKHIYHKLFLPLHHRDPFDRLIASQSLVLDIPLVSSDEIFDAYNVKRLWQ